MNIYLQIIIILLFMLTSNIVIFLYLINYYNKSTKRKVGPQIDSEFNTDQLNLKRRNIQNIEKKHDYILIFVEVGCISCEKVLSEINKLNIKNEFILIEVKDKDNTYKWNNIENYKMIDYEVELKELLLNQNINSFPFYISVKNKIVKKKGILNSHDLIKLINYENV